MQTTQSADSLVQEIMVEPTSVIESNEVVRTVRRRIAGETIRSLIVVENQRPIGVISQRNILDLDDEESFTPHMDTTVPILTPEMTLGEAQDLQAAEHDEDADYDRVPVVDREGRLIGEVNRGALYHIKRVAHGDEDSAVISDSPVKSGMTVKSVDDDKLGTVEDVIFDGSNLDSFTVKHGMLGRKHKRLQADLVSHADGDDVFVKIGKTEFGMLADIEDMEVES